MGWREKQADRVSVWQSDKGGLYLVSLVILE